ncbi:hypothetical protein [Streptosporangium amethystogenes]|uniref:thiolase family protein n=1 Tax=Streptosporangium amethystogenes TaxID=2002 RepID=UPI0004C77798|nr:hypothetical protein [Streptosporangium amethystogenes]
MAFIYASARTPFGRFNGALAGVRPDDLAATAITGVLAKAPAPARIGEIVWGRANQAGEDNRDVGRMAGRQKAMVAGGERYGVAAIRTGVGQALAVVLENVTGGAA